MDFIMAIGILYYLDRKFLGYPSAIDEYNYTKSLKRKVLIKYGIPYSADG